MREILGSGRRFTWPLGLLKSLGRKRQDVDRDRSALREAALTCAEQWHWPVLPGVGHDHDHAAGEAGRSGAPAAPAGRIGGGTRGDRRDRRTGASGERRQRPCACPRPDCAVPGAHPHDPGLLAATTDHRMVQWWWTRRPDAPLLLATGDPVSAVSLPATVGARVLEALEDLGVRLGPVVATPTRTVLLVAPYSMEELGDLLSRHEWVPSSLRYHGTGGYVVLPPSRTGGGTVCWARDPQPGADGTPYLPDIAVIVDMLVAAGVSAPDGHRLSY
ncbi:bifunctional DNA primase/polymerase [Streptantibioticus silvisoli]|uniref:Bifunctional DNA primase/polymerase n=1 Tax=Streptantibioticus silvisoli TaxID=2705255 RepID=A0ABT6W9V0_9ACTN|nr:bifunctional DNA primase/polymerase [Streptantibioticus silvisoli]MDI5967165.1 bifunctional DNA primase/polymerase [Streptantibioticus silvisoli]